MSNTSQEVINKIVGNFKRADAYLLIMAEMKQGDAFDIHVDIEGDWNLLASGVHSLAVNDDTFYEVLLLVVKQLMEEKKLVVPHKRVEQNKSLIVYDKSNSTVA